MRWHLLLVAAVFAVAACTTTSDPAGSSPDSPSTAVEQTEMVDAPGSPTGSDPLPENAQAPAAASTPSTPIPKAPTSSSEAPAPASTTTTRPVPTGTTVDSGEPTPQAILSRAAAAPQPVQIIEPTTTTIVVPATATEHTITFIAEGRGRIDWFVQELPDRLEIEVGRGSTIDITLPFPITLDTITYAVTANGRNPRAGQDSITVNLMRASS